MGAKSNVRIAAQKPVGCGGPHSADVGSIPTAGFLIPPSLA